MTEDDIKKLVCEIQAVNNKSLLDEFHKIAIGLRESTTPSFSKMMGNFTERLETVEKKIDTIFPSVQNDMEEAQFWKKLWSKVKEGGGALKWVVTVIFAILLLSGYAKAAVLSWLALK